MELKTSYKEKILSFIKDKLHLSINPEIKETASKISAVYDIPDDDKYGVIFSKLDKNSNIELLDDNQFVTEQGSSILYTTVDEPYFMISLLADYLNEKYSLNISLNKEKKNEQ